MGERGLSALLSFKTQISTTTPIILKRLELSERFMNNPGQGLGNEVIEPGDEVGTVTGKIECRERLGGMIRYYTDSRLN